MPDDVDEVDVTDLIKKIENNEKKIKILSEKIEEINSWIEEFTKNQE